MTPLRREVERRHALQQAVEREFGARSWPTQLRTAGLSVVELAESAVALDRFLALLVKHGFASAPTESPSPQ